MERIVGKAIIFTDLHLGLKSASKSRLAICIQAVKSIIQHAKQHEIKNVLFLGDWNHVRVSTENNVLNVSYKLMSALAKHCDVRCILGNHDIYMKNSSEINSLVIFKDLPNVKIISMPEEIDFNGKLGLMVPWLGDVSQFKKETYDLMFGHFDVSHKYLVKSYIEDHAHKKNAATDNNLKQLDTDQLLQDGITAPQTAGDYVGDVIDVVKRFGTVFSGHIHGRREFLAKGRKFILVGDPYQQNLGERDNSCGFYVLNEDGSYEFHEITSTPKHIQLRMSKIVDCVDNFDFSCIKGNIVHKIYDVDVDRAVDAKISQKITDWQPYEELLPDYDVDLDLNSEMRMQNESIELIKKSKMDYVKNYIKNIDPKVLKDQNIDSEKLYAILSEYYKLVAAEEK